MGSIPIIIWERNSDDMALNEIALVSLAWSLAANPTTEDIRTYQLLSVTDQQKIQQIIDQQGYAPPEFEILRANSVKSGGVNEGPSAETSSGL